ncbi:heavy metal translocating P-type ATPase [Phycicoccus jejuensis]|uniref:cation transporter n=1 Tax=Phycicoccus jejuensis TaxID=367299 RepID=UPI00384CF0EC
MTDASCAARVEKKLNRMDGVTATVKYAIEKVRVSFVDGISQCRRPRRDGRGHRLHGRSAAGCLARCRRRVDRPARAGRAAAWRQRLLVSAVLAAPVVVLSMLPWRARRRRLCPLPASSVARSTSRVRGRRLLSSSGTRSRVHAPRGGGGSFGHRFGTAT